MPAKTITPNKKPSWSAGGVGQSFCPSSHKDRKPERVAMSTINKIRTAIVLTIVSALTISLTACSPSGYGTDGNPKTSQFLYSQFQKGEYLDPFKSGKGDVGVTMEGMIQLSGVGYDKTKFAKAINWLKKNQSLLKTPGLKAEYIFTARALDFYEDPTVQTQLSLLKKSVATDGTVKDTNNFAYCWVIYGLLAAGEKDLANKVSLVLANQFESSGGYKVSFGDPNSVEAVDVTAFVGMTLKQTTNIGSETDQSMKTFVAGRTKVWLNKNTVDGDHWSSFGEADPSGTAYAAMAFRQWKNDTAPYSDWLKKQVNSKDGGIISPWSNGASDVFSTSQAILALNSLNFTDILNQKVK